MPGLLISLGILTCAYLLFHLSTRKPPSPYIRSIGNARNMAASSKDTDGQHLDAVENTFNDLTEKSAKREDDPKEHLHTPADHEKSHGLFKRVFHEKSLDNFESNWHMGNYVIINRETGKVSIATAGSEPVYRLERRARSRRLVPVSGRNLPLGLASDEKFVRKDIKLREGDSLLLLTDGITDAGAGFLRRLGGGPRRGYCTRVRARRWAGVLPPLPGLERAQAAHRGRARCGALHGLLRTAGSVGLMVHAPSL